MAKGAAWTLGFRAFDRTFGLVSTLILARLLTPADFGLVAMATVFLHLLVAISDFSLHVPLIQRSDLGREHLDTAWSLQLALGLIQGLVLLVLAAPVAEFYKEPRLVPIVMVLAFVAVLKSFSNIGVVLFQRDMQFHREFVFQTVRRLAAFAVTVTAAVITRSYWALILGTLIGAIAEVILSFGMQPYRPRLSKTKWRELLSFSKWMVLNNILIFLGRRVPDLVLGRLFGARSVGLFTISYEVAMLPTTELVAPINRVALPGYSRLKDEADGLQRGFLDVAGLIALFALPAAVGIACTAELLIPFLLGDQWVAAIPVVQVLALAGGLGALRTNTGPVFLALGRPAIMTAHAAIRVLALLPGIYLGAKLAGVSGVAVAYLVVSALMLIVNLGTAMFLLRIKLPQYLDVMYRPIVAVGIMYLAVGLFLDDLARRSSLDLAFSLGLAAGAGAGVYVATIGGLWYARGCPEGAETRARELFRSAIERLPITSGSRRRGRPGE